MKLEKLRELEYNELVTLGVIEKDEDLVSIFNDESSMSFDVVKELATDNTLDSETKWLIRNIFDQVIVSKKELISRYLRIANAIDVKVETINTPEVVEPVKMVIASEYGKFDGDFKTSEVKEKVIPRRYGKARILKDIEAQGGKTTELQKAMLAANKLKNIYVNISARGTKDMVAGTSILSDTDCRDIIAVVTMVERKLEEILKRIK